MSRNRSTGWQHAKISGHINESELEQVINNNSDEFDNLCSRILNIEGLHGSSTIGGLNETNIPCILGNTTAL